MNAVSAEATHKTTEARSVEAGGIDFAYRRLGNLAEQPLVTSAQGSCTIVPPPT